MQNSKSTRSNTGYKGIFFDKENGNFRARVTIDREGTSLQVGNYDTLKEAIQAREEFIKSLF